MDSILTFLNSLGQLWQVSVKWYFSQPLCVVKLTQLSNFTTVRSERLMETEKVLCYSAMGVAGLVCLIFLLDAALGILGRANIVMDIMFILGGAFVLWQGVETARELN